MSTARTTQRQARGTAGLLASTIRRSSRTRKQPRPAETPMWLTADHDHKHGGAIGLGGNAPAQRLPVSAARPSAQLLRAHVERARNGRRTLLVTIKARQKTAVSVRLAGPSGQLLLRTRATVACGIHTLRADIPAAVRPGAARLALALSSDAGTEHKHLRVPMPLGA
jgi:hypothetical protein